MFYIISILSEDLSLAPASLLRKAKQWEFGINFCEAKISAGGGIGRHDSLRGCWEQSFAGSNPVPRTKFAEGEFDPEKTTE